MMTEFYSMPKACYPHGKSEDGIQGYEQKGGSLFALGKNKTIIFDCDVNGDQSVSAIISFRNGDPYVIGNLTFTRWVREDGLPSLFVGTLPRVGSVINGGVASSAFIQAWQALRTNR